MKLIKYSMIAAVGVFLLPAPPPDSYATMQGGTRINLETGEVLSAAAMTYSDVSGFCQRQPGVCSTAGQAFTAFETRAKYNFQRLYEWSQSSDQPSSVGVIPSLSFSVRPQAQLKLPRFDPIITGSIERRGKPALMPIILAQTTQKPSDNTLRLEDLLPQWRGPVRTNTG